MNKNFYFSVIGLVVVSLFIVFLSTSSETTGSTSLDKIEDTREAQEIKKNVLYEQREKAKINETEAWTRDDNTDEGAHEGGSDVMKNPYAMAEGLDKLVRLANADGGYDFENVNKTKQDLLVLAKNNSVALDELLTAYSDNLTNESIQDLLFQIVSQVKDPKVEALGRELALSSDRDNRIAGFDLLGELQIPSEANLKLSMDALAQDTNDKELVLSALHALPKMPLSAEDNGKVVDMLSDLSTNENEAIRSESLISTAKWAKTEEELSAVIKALDSETIDDRISAAMALEQSTVVGTSLKTSLLAKIQDQNELWEVRSMSANALGRFNLSTSEFSSLQDFRKAQQGGVAH